MLKFITFNTGSEILCFLVAVICLSGNINFKWKLLIPYLFITCLTELTGVYLKKHHQPNQWPYNILLIFQIFIPAIIFFNLFNTYNRGKNIIICGIILSASLYVYDIIDHGFFIFNELTYNVMCVLYVIYCFYFFYLLLNSEHYIVITKSANFWWVSGSLFFYFGSTATNLFRDRLTPIDIADHNVTFYIYILLNIILYTCWSYSFICKKWLTKTSEL